MARRESVFITLLDREIHVTEWLSNAAPPVSTKVLIAWHGLLRTGRDFDEVAERFAANHGYRVLCPDTIGRGLSQWSPKPNVEYTVPFYVQLLEALVEQLVDRQHGVAAAVPGTPNSREDPSLTALAVTRGRRDIDFLGTSMGGIIGYCAAGGSLRLRGRIRRLVLNDVGPELNPVAIERIKQYGNIAVSFDRLSELEGFFKTVYAPFGPVTPAWLRRIVEVGYRRLPNGKVAPHYDPNVMVVATGGAAATTDVVASSSATGVAAAVEPKGEEEALSHQHSSGSLVPADPWALFDAIDCEAILITRGQNSDLLLPSGVEAMLARPVAQRCGMRSVTIDGCGHAPTFVPLAQQQILETFFLDGNASDTVK